MARTPEDRTATIDQMRGKVRRKYKVNHKKKKTKFAPGELQQLKMISVILKVAGYTHTQIGASVGVTRGQVGEWMKEPEIEALYHDTLEAIPAAAKNLLETYSIEAVHTIVDVMRTSTDDKMVLEAAKDILDRAGLPKASRSEIDKKETHKHELGASEDDMDLLRQLPPELQEKAAQAIENLHDYLGELIRDGEDAST